MTHQPVRSPLILGLCMLICLLTVGCFSERSFPMRSGDLVLIDPPPHHSPGPAARPWLVYAHARLKRLLPAHRDSALLTDDLGTADHPTDVFSYFKLDPRRLHTLLYNCTAISQTAQAAGAEPYIDRRPPAWPGFEDVWVPVAPEVQLAARLGFALQADGTPRAADCIVLLPGLLGDNGVLRTRDIACALRTAGFHVLALEQRGHGQTEARYPNIPYTWGAFETGDLLAVSEWLQDMPQVRRTGLVGFCWGANHALVAAWEDGRRDDDPDAAAPRMRAMQRPHSPRRHYEAGIIAYSPVLRFENLIEASTRDWTMLQHPVYNAMQETICDRAVRKHFPEATRSFRKVIEFDAMRAASYYEGAVDDGIDYVRLMPHGNKRVGPKLAAARVPVLIVHGSNDPLAPAQDVADFLSPLQNPNVAAVILPGGGHVGFAPHSRAYFYSLMINFFDPQRGPAPAVPTSAPAQQ